MLKSVRSDLIGDVCPSCRAIGQSKVLSKDLLKLGGGIRRRRECICCGERFTMLSLRADCLDRLVLKDYRVLMGQVAEVAETLISGDTGKVDRALHILEDIGYGPQLPQRPIDLLKPELSQLRMSEILRYVLPERLSWSLGELANRIYIEGLDPLRLGRVKRSLTAGLAYARDKGIATRLPDKTWASAELMGGVSGVAA